MMTSEELSVQRISFESLERCSPAPDQLAIGSARAVHEVRIRVGHVAIAVRFSHASPATAFAERYCDLLGQAEPQLVIYAASFGGAAHFWSSPNRVWRWAEDDPSDQLIVFFADNVMVHEYLTTSAAIGFHAAVVGYGSRVLAIVGQSTAGKTTTALALARKGFALYSDERCILQDGLVVPFLRAISIRDGGRAALLATATPGGAIDDKLRHLPSNGDAAIRPTLLLGPAAGGPPQPLGALFLLVGRGLTPDIEPCSIYGALPLVLRSMMSSSTGLDRATRVFAHLRQIPIYRLRLGTPEATATAIEEMLSGTNSASN